MCCPGAGGARGPKAKLAILLERNKNRQCSLAAPGVPGAHLHLYGKAPRAERKLGHVTVRAHDETQLQARLAQVQALVGRSEG